jgi:hypothetical protein
MVFNNDLLVKSDDGVIKNKEADFNNQTLMFLSRFEMGVWCDR